MNGAGASVMVEDRPNSPAHAECAITRDVLERTLFEIQRSPAKMDRPSVVDAFGKAIEATTKFAKSNLDDDDHFALLESAINTALHAQSILAAQKQPELEAHAAEVKVVADALAACLPRVVDAQGARRFPQWRGKVAAPNLAPAFRASQGISALVQVDRGPIAAPVRILVPEEDLIQEDEIPSGDEDEDEDSHSEPAKPAALPPAPNENSDCAGAAGEEATLRRLARELMEEIGSLGALCFPPPARPWSRALAVFEQRLLAAFDAFIALGEPVISVDGSELRFDILGELLEYSNAAVVPDPARAFARTFVLSCVMGEDRVRAAVVAMQQAHPSTYPAHRDAFILGSSPSIGPAMRRLCNDAPPPILRVALDVLAARREATVPSIAPLLEHPDPSVRIRAVRCLATTTERNPSISLLAQVIGEEADTRVVAAAMRTLVRRGEPYGLESARQALRANRTDQAELHTDARLDMLELLGIAGNASDGPLLQSALAYRPREAEALGWHGSPGHVEPLLAALHNAMNAPGKKLFCAGIAGALARITGANIVDASGQPWADPGAWQGFWAENRAKFSSSLRYRFGKPYTPLSTLDELSSDGTTVANRDLCVLELDVITAGGAEIDLRRWTALGDMSIQRLRSAFGDKPKHADGSAFSPGEWVSSRWLRRGAI